jgi:hypothetical protein
VHVSGVEGWCDLCGTNGPRVTVEELAEWIDPVYRELYRPGGYEPRFRLNSDADNIDWEQEGESPSWVLQELAGVDVELADALVDFLAEGDWAGVRDGDDAMYDQSACYVRIDRGGTVLFGIWRDFEQRVKHGRRFHDPDDPAAYLYRARQAGNEEEAHSFARNPSVELAPPPPEKRTGGRLNAPGIAVFYGAFNPETCIAEIRPAVGSWLAVAAFAPTRPLRLLDLTAFSSEPPPGSPFATGYLETVERWRFLSVFHAIASAPVLPGNEALGYVATQAVAEYLANAAGFDGVIYASAQMGGVRWQDTDDEPVLEETAATHCNVALFDAAECVAKVGSLDGENGDAQKVHPWAESGFPRLPSRQSCGTLRYVEASAQVHRISAAAYVSIACDPLPPPPSTSEGYEF